MPDPGANALGVIVDQQRSIQDPGPGSGVLPDPGLKVYRSWILRLVEIMKNCFAKLVKDEQGGEVLEYALIAGLIVVGAIALIAAVGDKVVARWTSMNSSL